ncbi:MAG: hypothetical protein K0Q77_18 [Anaerosporomusa subterranea]|nr:hypothetical protein [Anaerosporomusa subterranea]
MERVLNSSTVNQASSAIRDLQLYGAANPFTLLAKASSEEQGFMKTTKVMNVPGGCLVQTETQQRNRDGSYALSQALCFVPGVRIDKDAEPRQMVEIGAFLPSFVEAGPGSITLSVEKGVNDVETKRSETGTGKEPATRKQREAKSDKSTGTAGTDAVGNSTAGNAAAE